MTTVAVPTRVLMIEDDQRDAELACIRLERAGIAVQAQVVADAEGVRAALRDAVFDLILSDFQLPGFSGSEALQIARRLAPDVPFVVVSGMLGEEHAVEMLKAGATDYVLKQRLERLPLVVRRALTEANERAQRSFAERTLRERERYFSQLVDTLKDYSVASLDREGRIESWNTASETIFGYAAAEVLGRTPELFFENGDGPAGLRRELEQAAQSGSCVHERWQLRRDASRFHASIVTTAIFDEGGALRGFSRIVRDTTDSRVAADLLQSAKEQAEAANQAKDRFLAVLSHELRNPLSPIAAAAYYLDLQSDLTEEARTSVEMIKRNVELEARLIDDLLDISRIVNDKLTLALDRVELVALVAGAVEVFRSDAVARGIDLRFETTLPEAPIYGDEARLQQVIWNLLKNALKFTGSGGNVRVRMEKTDDGRVAVAVEDTGIGIRADALQRIFQAFDQGDNGRESSRGGLGLGLAIANSLTQKHGGTLTVHSDGIGRGATFVLMLNLHDGKGSAARSESGAVLAADGRPLRILVVEDNEDTAAALGHVLRRLGHEAVLAYSVRQATELLRGGAFDVLLSDMGLPDGDGIDVLRRFEPGGGRLAVALTGYGMQGDVQRSLAAGFSEHMTKPVDFDRLSALLRSVGPGAPR